MTKRYLTLSTVTAAAFLIAPFAAFGADLPLKAPPLKAPVYVPAPLWTGFYLGVNGGYGFDDPTIDFTPNPVAAAILAVNREPQSVTVRPQGMLAGLQGGYNYQWGSVVLGAEADIDYAAIKGHGESVLMTTYGNLPAAAATTGEESLNWFGTLRARLGYLPWDSLLVYGTGGLAFGHASLSGMMVNTQLRVGACAIGTFCAGASTSKWMLGWTIGAGIEYALYRNWTVKAEYLYYDLGSQSVDLVDARYPATVTASGDFKGNIVRAGANYRF